MSSHRPRIVEALRRLDPTQAAEGADYIPRGVGGSAAWPWPGKLVTLLEAGLTPRVLLQGSIGVGKSTELKRWEKELRAAGLVPLRGTAQDEAAAWNLATQTAQSGPRGKRVVLIDGLDRLPASALGGVFGPGARLAGRSPTALVVAAPVALMTLDPVTHRHEGFDTVLHLPAFPVVDEAGALNDDAITALAGGLERRLADLDLLDDRALLRRVVVSSGGIPRDAVRILRSAVLAAIDSGRITGAHVLDGEREVRQDLEQALVAVDRDALIATAQDPKRLTDGRLLTANAVIAYEGPTHRYFRVHPLLADYVKQPRGRIVVGGVP